LVDQPSDYFILASTAQSSGTQQTTLKPPPKTPNGYESHFYSLYHYFHIFLFFAHFLHSFHLAVKSERALLRFPVPAFDIPVLLYARYPSVLHTLYAYTYTPTSATGFYLGNNALEWVMNCRV
jgi:hypothetical protein